MLLRSWSTGLSAPWGLAVANGTLWVNDTSSAGGDGLTHAFSKDGMPQPGSIAQRTSEGYFADLAYDPLRGRLWQAAVSGEPCVEELDPSTARASGVKICPHVWQHAARFGLRPAQPDLLQRHLERRDPLAFRPERPPARFGQFGNQYFRDSPITRAASACISCPMPAVGYDVYVVEARQPYRILGGFDVPGMANFGQAGLD